MEPLRPLMAKARQQFLLARVEVPLLSQIEAGKGAPNNLKIRAIDQGRGLPLISSTCKDTC